ncbi:Serine/threonine phosphatase stp [Rubripirellula amarantea]|uniref:Serine/threonine phosphatase stp n=1 Tax=Rubripirellula amarantea TaxID=2527999 RepID=A0A5C5WEL4_9BACT|nr:protein phosphatase 2C domain-containing protein [Rubripirellula amarantea]TWT49366.1 Serine/threonine phosphatase stp [Rubripirellula amarantea]
MATASPQKIDSHLYLESDMVAPEWLPLTSRIPPIGNLVAFSRRCPGKEEPNDDSAAIFHTADDGIVLAVADGVGGAPLGYKASAIVMQCLSEALAEIETCRELRPAILDGIEKANAEILDMGTGAATTVCVVEIRDRVARGYQVGDSMALIVGQRGLVKWKSTAHSPVGYAIESGMIDEQDAMHHDERHLVSNLVGSRSMHIEIGPAVPLAAKDSIVLASDGLFDNLHLEEVINLSRVGRPLHRMQSLIELADARMNASDSDTKNPGKPDDLAIVMLTP